jgi:drug/metabolite transporter (DMT)-like permease
MYCQAIDRYCNANNHSKGKQMAQPGKWKGLVTTEKLGLALGFLGVAGFSLTFPATRVAVTYLDPVLVGLGRSVAAGALAAALLWLTRQPPPTRAQVRSLAVVAGGVIIGFPLLSAWALRQLPASHAAVLGAILPLLTAIVGALRTGERASSSFWVAAVLGSGVVVTFAWVSGTSGAHGADIALLAAALAAAVGYAEGGRLAKEMGGWQVICWALVLAAPVVALPAAFAAGRHGLLAPPEAWLGFAYVSLVSQLLGFFLWYQGMALAGVVRVSQIQLLQPFLTMLAAALLLGEHITLKMAGFGVAAVAAVAAGQQFTTKN